MEKLLRFMMMGVWVAIMVMTSTQAQTKREPSPVNTRGDKEAMEAATSGSASSTVSNYGYLVDYFSGQLARISLSIPSASAVIGTSVHWLQGIDFGTGGVLYALSSSPDNTLMQIDTTNAATTTIGTATPASGHLWSGLAFDPTTNTMYASSTTGNTESAIYTVDTNTGAATLVGTTSVAVAVADIAIDDSGQMYALDLGIRAIYLVDKTNGSVTLVGNVGYAPAGFWHGMDFQPGTNELYLASYHSIPMINELRTVNLTNGSTTVVGTINYQSGAFAIPGGAAASAQISVSPTSIVFDSTGIGTTSMKELTVHNTGTADLNVSDVTSSNSVFTVNLTNFTVSPGGSQVVDVTFAPTQQTGYTGTIQITSNDPNAPTLDVPVEGVGTIVVGISDDELLPNEFFVSQNFPNPFNPSTMIRYQVPMQSEVQLVVYNMLGQKVRILVNDLAEPGYYQVIWDGRDDAGKQLPSGIYIYNMTAGKFNQMRKMLFLK